ncbi:Glucose-6-phosphate isomerase [Trichinella spiralis]|uniref:Glucose-6-phosphate isomerase n=1 Tax=Trichinella spiralis TaxID=6334 RepID=A0ABR3K4Z9_TRISP
MSGFFDHDTPATPAAIQRPPQSAPFRPKHRRHHLAVTVKPAPKTTKRKKGEATVSRLGLEDRSSLPENLPIIAIIMCPDMALVGLQNHLRQAEEEWLAMRTALEFISRSRNIMSPLDTFSRIFLSDLIDVIGCRPVSFPLIPKLKGKLESLENQGIIQKLTAPSEWLRPIMIVPKKSGDIPANGRKTGDAPKIKKSAKVD